MKWMPARCWTCCRSDWVRTAWRCIPRRRGWWSFSALTVAHRKSMAATEVLAASTYSASRTTGAKLALASGLSCAKQPKTASGERCRGSRNGAGSTGTTPSASSRRHLGKSCVVTTDITESPEISAPSRSSAARLLRCGAGGSTAGRNDAICLGSECSFCWSATRSRRLASLTHFSRAQRTRDRRAGCVNCARPDPKGGRGDNLPGLPD